MDQYVGSTKPIPTGDCRLPASFEKSGTGMPTEGALSLYINQEKVGEGKIRPSPASSPWPANPHAHRYPPPPHETLRAERLRCGSAVRSSDPPR